jgi:tetrapyrrole methylase family protein/MazG family protein
MDFTLVNVAFETLRIPAPSRLVLLEAVTLASAHVPPYPPDMAALLTGVESQELARHLKGVLRAAYPDGHSVVIIDSPQQEKLQLSSFDEFNGFSSRTCLFIPPLEEGTSFESFAEIVAHLRAPNGCPWDREQTHESLRTHLMEEAYEALSAIDAGDYEAMREEFGDLLLQIVLQAQIAAEEDQFTASQVLKNIYDKITRRHPHVFGDLKLSGVEGVLQNWERLKEHERSEKKEGKGLLDGVPLALPALSQAQEYQERAARVGFDWPEIEGVLDKVKEEIEEIKQAENKEQVASELGDLLFVLVNLARWRKVNAESALRQANARFKRRFAYVERGSQAKNKLLTEMTLEEMDALWEQGKREEG